jgi:hypothetical protein
VAGCWGSPALSDPSQIPEDERIEAAPENAAHKLLCLGNISLHKEIDALFEPHFAGMHFDGTDIARFAQQRGLQLAKAPLEAALVPQPISLRTLEGYTFFVPRISVCKHRAIRLLSSENGMSRKDGVE